MDLESNNLYSKHYICLNMLVLLESAIEARNKPVFIISIRIYLSILLEILGRDVSIHFELAKTTSTH